MPIVSNLSENYRNIYIVESHSEIPTVEEKFEKTTAELNERQKRAIGYLRRNEKITNKEYQEINKTTKKTATRDLQELVGLVIPLYWRYSMNGTFFCFTQGHIKRCHERS